MNTPKYLKSIIFLLITFSSLLLNAEVCECPAVTTAYDQEWRLKSSEIIDENSDLQIEHKSFCYSTLENIPHYTDMITSRYPSESSKKLFYYTSMYPPNRKFSCKSTLVSLPDGLNWRHNMNAYCAYYDVLTETNNTRLACSYCNEADSADPIPDGYDRAPDLYVSEVCSGLNEGSIDICTEAGGIVIHSKTNCCRKEVCAVEQCSQEDESFPTLSSNQRILFTWDASDNNRTQECTALHAQLQQATENCQSKYRCTQVSYANNRPCNEEVGSYVSPGDGVFHEDIEIDGTPYTLHYQSADLTIGSIGSGWSFSVHANIQNDTLFMGNGKRYFIDAAYTEGDKKVIVLGSVELVFNVNNKHIMSRDSYTKSVLYKFTYNIDEKLIGITDRFGLLTEIVRSSNSVVTEVIAPHAQVTQLNIDTQNDLLSVVYEDGSSYEFEYDAHLMIKEREPKGNEFTHVFDSDGKIIKIIDAEAAIWNFEQKDLESSEVIDIFRASGDIVDYQYHHLENGFLRLQKSQPNGDVIIQNAALDDSETYIESCGIHKHYSYLMQNGATVKDPVTHKRILKNSSITTPNSLQQIRSYSRNYIYAGTQLLSTKQTSTQNGATTTLTRDFNTATITITTPEGRKSTIEFDSNLLPKSVKNTNIKAIKYWYDTEGRIVKHKQGKRVVRYTYDARGNLLTRHNVQKDITTQYRYDERDRITQIIYANGYSTQFDYDANGNMRQLTTPTPTKHTYTYNGVNRPTSYTSPLDYATTYTYDEQRRITKITRPSGKSIINTYTNGELTKITTPEGVISYDYTCGSKPSIISNINTALTFSYDGDLLTNIKQTGVLNQSIAYRYNNDFRVISSHYGDITTGYSYDLDGLLIRSGDFNITRDPLNGLTTRVTDGVLQQKRIYNQFGEIKSQKAQGYSYRLKRKQGRIAKKSETVITKVLNKRGRLKKEKSTNTYFYTYDNRGRVIEVKKGKKAQELVEQYFYDANGNRAKAIVYGQTITASYTLDDQLEVYGQNTYHYDEDGYLNEKTTPDGITSYIYGTLGELKEVTTPQATITYLHNANNQRVAKLKDGIMTEKYLWADLTTLLAIYDKNDNLIQRFEYADQRMPISLTQNGQKYYLHYDQAGTLRVVTQEDGTIVKQIAYDTFGNVLSESNASFKVPFGFAGGLYDSDTKLTRFGYRDYDAYTGKWTAKDPIGFNGGDSNLYGYVLGDPVDFVDPFGLFQFGFRPLSGMNNSYSLGPLNIGLLHENGFFSNGANVGYFPTGIGGDNSRQLPNYTMDPTQYDDNIMIQALNNLLQSGRWLPDGEPCNNQPVEGMFCDYDLIPHNCQDFADALRNEYFRLGGRTQ